MVAAITQAILGRMEDLGNVDKKVVEKDITQHLVTTITNSVWNISFIFYPYV